MRCRSTGRGHGPDVLALGVEAAVQHGPGLGPQHQVLAGPRTGAPTDVVLDEIGHVPLLAARQPREPQRVAGHVVGHRHPADDLLQRQDLLGRERRRRAWA